MGNQPVDPAWQHAVSDVWLHPQFRQLAVVGFEEQRSCAGNERDGLVLFVVPLEAEPMATGDEEQLPDVRGAWRAEKYFPAPRFRRRSRESARVPRTVIHRWEDTSKSPSRPHNDGMFVVFIHGPAASGKYTIGKLVAEALGIRLFHNHLVVDALLSLFEFGSPAFRALREQIWLGAFEGAASEGTSFVFTFLPEATVSPGFVDEAVRVVESAGGSVLFVELTCDDAVVRSRLDSPSRREFGKLTSVDQFSALAQQGAFRYSPMPPYAVSVPTDLLEPDEAARVISAAISNATRESRGR